MRSILVILGVCLLIPSIVFGIDKSWLGFYGSSEYGRNTGGVSNCGFYIDDEVEGHVMDSVEFHCRNKNKFDFDFGGLLKQVNKNTLEIINWDKKVGTITRNGDGTLSMKPDLIFLKKVIICNGKDNPKDRVCKKGTKKQLEEFSRLISGMKFKKEF